MNDELPIEPGDVCIDLTSGRALHVMEKAADRADEWSLENNYELTENYGNARVGAAEDDTVWTCVYANSIQSEPSKDYAFPESRLRRVETERANGGERVQDEVRFEFAVQLLDAAEKEVGGDVHTDVHKALRSVDRDLGERVVEFVEASRNGTRDSDQ